MIHVFRENEEQLFKVKTERDFFFIVLRIQLHQDSTETLRDGGFSVVAPAGFDIREVDTADSFQHLSQLFLCVFRW